MSGNLGSKRECIGRVARTHRAKRRLEPQSENRSGHHGAPRLAGDTVDVLLLRRGPLASREALCHSLQTHSYRSESDGLNLRHMPATDSEDAERAKGLSLPLE